MIAPQGRSLLGWSPALGLVLWLSSVLSPCDARAQTGDEMAPRDSSSAETPPPEEPADPRSDCEDCRGSGKVTCTECDGKKKAAYACPDCDDEGKRVCTYRKCRDGRMTCNNTRCNGGKVPHRVISGYKRKGRFKYPTYKTVDRDCSTCNGSGRVKCSRCSGEGKKKCPECRGKNRRIFSCRKCSRSGEIACPRCRGEGKVGFAVDARYVDAERDNHQDAHEEANLQLARRLQMESLSKAMGRIRTCNGEVSKLDKEYQRVKSRFVESGKAYRSAKDLELWTRGLRDARDRLRYLWKQADGQWTSLCEIYGDLRVAPVRATAHLEKMGKLAAALKRPDSPPAEPSAIREETEFSEHYGSQVRQFRVQLGELLETLEETDSAVARLGELHRQAATERQAERDAQRAIEEAFGSFKSSFSALTAGLGLPDVDCALRDDLSAPAAIAVEITYEDDQAELSERPSDVEPAEGYLRELPQLIDRSFDVNEDIARIDVKVMGRRLSQTGIVESCQIQQFIVARETWGELSVGRYKDEWKELLSRVKTNPPYPRRVLAPVGGSGTVMMLVVLLIVALSVVVIARLRIT